MKIKQYQEEAINELHEKTKKLLIYKGTKKIVFEAPTGSGKTFIVSQFISRLVKDSSVGIPISFVWTAPRQLHIQSKNKIEDYFNKTRICKCSFFDDLQNQEIEQDEILFFNWESINKKNNLFIRENENDNNLSNVLLNTKQAGRQIILVVDESHFGAPSEISQKLIEDINPKIVLEVSATPIIVDPDEKVTVHIEDVKNEGMIKKNIILNPDFDNSLKNSKVLSKLSSKSEQFLIDVALKKRCEILKCFNKAKENINPLVLIQLPDRKSNIESELQDKVISYLKKTYNITTSNGKLAIWLSDETENLEPNAIVKNDNSVQVLIFKQAPALGWDCPRAQILVLFRDWKSITFSIQVIGRIMRMPNPFHGHYKQEVLNSAYVFTNIGSIYINESIAKDYISVFKSFRNKTYKKLNLLSCHSKRFREKTRLNRLFTSLFFKKAKEYKLSSKIIKTGQKVCQKIISNYKTDNVSDLLGKQIDGLKVAVLKGEESQKYFDFFLRNSLSPFYPEQRSVDTLKQTLYDYFKVYLKLDYEQNLQKIIEILLSSSNESHFKAVIELAKVAYQSAVGGRNKEIDYDTNWQIPSELIYNSYYNLIKVKKSIMNPFYTKDLYKTESAFIKYLDNQKNVKWWFKNGDRDSTYFAIPYTEKGDIKPFYIDFIVCFQNNKIGLYDTKSGFTKDLAGAKSYGLQNYIKKHKVYAGGIVTNSDQRNYKGVWMIYRKLTDGVSKNLKEWDTLHLG